MIKTDEILRKKQILSWREDITELQSLLWRLLINTVNPIISAAGLIQKYFRFGAALIRWRYLLQNLIEEFESETRRFLYSTFLQQKQLFTIHKHALQGTAGPCPHEI